MHTDETTAAMFTKIEVALATLIGDVKNVANEVARYSTLPDRMARTETRIDEAEKQQALYRAEADKQAANLRWLLGIFATALVALATFVAAHIPWK